MDQINPDARKSGALLFESLEGADEELVHSLVKRHAEETGSAFAQSLLDDWEHTRTRITHVTPKHYVAMTKAMEQAEKNHVDFNAPGAWEHVYEQVMEGAH